jgi:hypothetical protein
MSDFHQARERLRATFKQLARLPDDESPPPPERCHPVLRPELARHVQIWTPRTRDVVRLLATEGCVWHLMLHRIDQRSEACVAETRYCYGCACKMPARWMGYIGACIWHTRIPVVLSVTPGALVTLAQKAAPGTDLRRRWLETARSQDNVRSRQWLHVGHRTDTAVIPYETMAAPVLGRRYNLPYDELRVLHRAACQTYLDRRLWDTDDTDTR